MSGSVRRVDQARLELYDIMGRDADFQEKVSAALELGKDYLGVDNAHLTRIDTEIDYWENVASTDPPDGQFPAGQVLDLNSTYCRRVLQSGDTVALHDAPAQGWAEDPAYQEHGLRCYHGTPLTVDGEQFGTVCFVGIDARREPFSESDTLFADLVGRLIEHELERNRHAADTARRANSITVLSRVLRHNLRNEMTVVRGRISALVDALDDESYLSDALFDSIDRIIGLSDKARKLETVVSTQFDREPLTLDPMLERIVTDTSNSYPGASISVDGATDLTIDAMPSLELALSELVENAAKHAGETPDVRVTVEETAETVVLSVTDDGPGLPEQERDVLSEGVETPLLHGSGLGLWMVYWIVTNHDGSIDAAVGDGTSVTVTLPRMPGGDTELYSEGSEQLLQRGHDRFEAVFSESFDAMVILNDEYRVIDANGHAADMVAVPKQELLGRPIGAFVPDSCDLDTVWEELEATGRQEGQVPLVGADGIERVVEYSATADIIPGHHLFIGRDVTERTRRERQLASRNRQIETLLRTVDAAVYVKDAEGAYQLMNQECRDLLGIAAEADVTGLTDTDVFSESVAEQVHACDRRVLEDGETVEVEEHLPTEEGLRTYLSVKSPMYDEDGTVIGLCGVSTDITDRIEREQVLEETTASLEAVQAASPIPVIALDADGVVTLWNDAAEAVFGRPAEAVVGESLADLGFLDADQRSALADRLERVLDGEQVAAMDVERTSATGERLSLRIATAPLRGAAGEIDGVVAFATDRAAVPDAAEPAE